MKRPIRTTFIRITITMGTALFLIVMIAWLTPNPLYQKNGFSRQLTGKLSSPSSALRKSPDIWNISGLSKNGYYFQGIKSNHIYRTDLSLNNLDTTVLAIPTKGQYPSSIEMIPDSPWVWVFAKNMPATMLTRLDSQYARMSKLPKTYYTRVAKTENNTLIYRAFDTSMRKLNQVFMKGDPNTGSLQKEKNISEKHNDGGFSTDGLLYYDSLTNLLAYVSYYNNKFLCLDTNLNVVYVGRTVDTLAGLQTTTGGTNKGEKIIYSNTGPSNKVNAESCTWKGKLYNLSQIKADNETVEDFLSNGVIDIYDIKTGNYEGSFYVPDYKGEKLWRFRVYGDTVLALYKHYIVTYKLTI